MYVCKCFDDFLKEQGIENIFNSEIKPDWSKYKPKCEVTCGEKYGGTIKANTIKLADINILDN
jgi:hypothetical protein